jgi:pimeloyl-ACP methyl ester carboxylesterase
VPLPLPELEGVRHRFVDVRGVRTHVAEAGPPGGEAVILVHGWPQHWWCWREVVPVLANLFRCIAPDLRGHGWSEAPEKGYDKESLGEDVVGLLDTLGIDRAGYVGHDWGGWIGFLVALRHPDRIRGLLALSISHPWPSLRDRLNPLRAAALAYHVPLSTPVVGNRLMRAGLTRWVLQTGAAEGTFTKRDLDLYNAAMGSPAGARATVALYRTFLLRELPAIAAGRYADGFLTVPTRLLAGEKDPIALGTDLGGYQPHAEEMTIERVDGARHFLPEERPKLVCERATAMFA